MPLFLSSSILLVPPLTFASMASLTALSRNGLLIDRQHIQVIVAASSILFFVGLVFFLSFSRPKCVSLALGSCGSYAKFFYVSFLKPHTGDSRGDQQNALESFYKFQVCPTYQFLTLILRVRLGRCIRHN